MNKKFFFKTGLFLFLLIILINILYFYGHLDFFKNKIPKVYKERLKTTIFYFTHLKKKNELLTKYSNEVNLRNQKLEFLISLCIPWVFYF